MKFRPNQHSMSTESFSKTLEPYLPELEQSLHCTDVVTSCLIEIFTPLPSFFATNSQNLNVTGKRKFLSGLIALVNEFGRLET